MIIGIAGPISVSSLTEHLPNNQKVAAHKSLGMGGDPVNALIHYLLKANLEVVVFSLDTRLSPSENVVLRGNRLEIRIGSWKSERTRAGRCVKLGGSKFLTEEINRSNVDLIHAHWTGIYSEAAIQSSKPHLVTLHDWIPSIIKVASLGDLPWLLKAACQQKSAIRRSLFVSGNSPYIVKKLEEASPRKHCFLVPNIVDSPAIEEVIRPSPPSPTELLAVNNGFTKWKNVKSLLKAMPIIRKSVPEARLTLVGRGYEEDGPAHIWARRRNLHYGCKFLGWISKKNLSDVYKSTAIFVHPSLEESFGNVIVEACRHGLVVIGGERSGAVPWLLEWGSSGVITDVRKPKKIASECIKLMESKELRDRYVRRSSAYLESQISPNGVLSNCLDLYRMVIRHNDSLSASSSRATE
jgi:glycosyltransferase involved in cell wall biosynthesis